MWRKTLSQNTTVSHEKYKNKIEGTIISRLSICSSWGKRTVTGAIKENAEHIIQNWIRNEEERSRLRDKRRRTGLLFWSGDVTS